MLKRTFFLFVVLVSLFAFDKASANPTDGYIEVKRFCTKYNYVLYIHYKKGILAIKKARRSIKITVGTNLAIDKDKVYFLDKPIIQHKGEVYIPLSFAKRILEEERALKSTKPFYKPKVKKEDKKEDKRKASPRRINFIVIDPGHGGKDPGNVHGKMLEKTLNLKISKKLVRLLKKRFPNIAIYLTRDKDVFLSLDDRVDIAASYLNSASRNGLFISIHANAAFNPQTKGIETFFYSSFKTKASKNSTKKRLSVVDTLTYTLTDDARTNKALSLLYNLGVSKESKVLAEYVNDALYARVRSYTLNRGIKSQKAYLVVTNSAIPSILLEIGFLSNKEESTRLQRASYQAKVVAGIVDGIDKFVSEF